MHAGSRRARLTELALSWCKQQGRGFRESPQAIQQWQDSRQAVRDACSHHGSALAPVESISTIGMPCRGYTHFQRPPFSQQQGRSGVYVTAAALGLGSILYINSLQEVPYTHRKHAVWLTTDMERAIGKAAFEQVFHHRHGQVLQVFKDLLGALNSESLSICRSKAKPRSQGHSFLRIIRT